ncbi:alpha/beta-Hydrolases superfamily protein [Raphanus sativus]|uniref:Caffeoylshikimate esterase-like n=1 Tax=Raphanus sativus TaxID=3726 RepID=A0A6J0KHC8_RAPSA|nr:caffeoylshikimate esterase-like [Raphanus sativus]KAJ4879153.1 alpha/beta-Hydrolases superfamily protein [Raphanus sativus]
MSDHNLSPEINFWGDDTPEQDYFNLKGIVGSKSYFKSPRGLNLFTRSWLPSSSSPPPRGLIFMVHGYGNDISWTFQSTSIFLAQNGFACFALDIEGHGRSDGVRAYVPSVDLVVADIVSFIDTVKKKNPNYRNLPRFLFGESMGGAISLLIHFADPLGFSGAVLVAPMCKISDKVRPKWPIDQFLITISRFAPTWAIVPTEDLLEKCIKVEEKKPIARRNPMRYREKPRLGTVMELLRVTDYLGKKLKDVSIPFIVLHGSVDVVTDPEVSRELYEEAKSGDKTLKIYEGMMHSMLFGETDENIEIVRGDIVGWLNDRCGGGDRT